MNKKLIVAAVLVAAASFLPVSAATKNKGTAEVVPPYSVKSGVIVYTRDLSQMGQGMRGGMGGGQMGGMMMGGQGMGQGTPRQGMGPGMGQGQGRGQGQQGQQGQGQRQRPEMTGTQVTKIYFDDYGLKTATVTEMGERVTRQITVDGAMVTVNDTEKTATRMPSFGGRGGQGGMGGFGGGMGGFGGGMMGGMGGSQSQVNWSNLDEKTIKRNRIKELGEEEIAGVTCKKYSIRVATMGETITQYVWVYKGVTLKTESETDWGTMGQEASAFEEDVEISESMFTVPEGVEIQEMNMDMMRGGMGGGMGGFGGGAGGFGGGMGGF